MSLRKRHGGSVKLDHPTTSFKMQKKPRVLIVGGGPAGAAIAKSLADKGMGDNVRLFEAYPHPKKIKKNSPSAYVIALSMRGQAGLQKSTGIVPSEIPGSVVSTNLARHPSGKIRKHDKLPSLIVPRQTLTSHLLDEAEKAGAQINLEHRLLRIDFKKRLATFQSTTSKSLVEVPYDLLIGADGSKSIVRSLLSEEKVDDFKVIRTEEDSMEYQVVTIASHFDNEFPYGTVHAWNDKKYNSICLGFPLANNAGTLLAIVYPEGKLSAFKDCGYDDAMSSLLPDLSESVRTKIIEQLAVGEPTNGGKCVWTSSLGSAKYGVALVGDSGHGMWPSLGQGANCALESVGVFCQTVVDIVEEQEEMTTDLSPSSWSERVVREFNKRRHKDALAAVDLTYGGIGERKSRGRMNAPLTFKLQVAIMMILNLLTIGIVPKPALIRVMGGEDVTYSTARKFNFIYEKLICVGSLLLCTMAPVLMWYY